MKCYTKIIITGLIFLWTVFPIIAQTGEDETFDRAVAAYREKQNEKAVELFETFLDSFPNSIDVDDAYWYLGRLYVRMDDTSMAESYFTKVFEWPERSSRLSATLYDMAKIYYSQDNYQRVISLTEYQDFGDELNRNDRRYLYLLGKSYYRLGYRNLNDYSRTEAALFFEKAAEILSMAVEAEPDLEDRYQLLIALGETYLKALDAATNRASYNQLYNRLETIIMESEGPELDGIEKEFKALKKADFSAELEAAGGLSTIATTPGFQLNAKVGLDIPLGFRQELRGKVGYQHDSFSVKTFNFLPDEAAAGDIRLIQSTDDISGKLSWVAGSRRFIYSRFSISGGAGWADDPEDNYLTIKGDESFDIRVNRFMKTGIDTDVRWKVFPNYLVNNRKLDYIQWTFSPYIELSPVDNLEINTAYQFEMKQYLDAKYESSPGIPAQENRQYLLNSGEIAVAGKLWSIFRPGVGYRFTYNKSNNYNITVEGLPADIFIQGYYDFYEHEIRAQADFRVARRLRVDIDGSVAFRNFINYPARDGTKTFTGDIRKDREYEINGSVEYIIWPAKKNGITDIGIYLDTGYTVNTSNMTYETSFQTNYDNFTFVMGLHIDLP